MLRTAVGLIAGAAVAACLTACTSEPPSISESSASVAPPSASPVAIAGTVWVGDRPAHNTRIEFTSDGVFTGTDGCNTVGGEWMTHDGRVIVRSFGGTQVLCTDVGWAETPSYGLIEADHLTLFDEHGTVIEVLSITT